LAKLLFIHGDHGSDRGIAAAFGRYKLYRTKL